MTATTRTYGIIITIAVLGVTPWPLAADTPPADTDAPALGDTDALARADAQATSAPWREGVAPADQETATALFQEALTLQRQWLLPDAAARYEQALARWDHPKIRFYLGRTQEKMGDLVAAYENLRLALRWGLDAFPPADARMAREMLRRLEAGLSRVEVRCDEPGAEVFVDGKPWFVGPGSKQAMLRPGEHAIIARKAGFFTVTRSISLAPGKQATVVIGLSPETVVRGRLEGWQPWQTLALAGTGAALALAGGVLEGQAARHYAEYEQRFRAVCQDRSLCYPHQKDPHMPGKLRRASWENRGAIAAFSLAGVALVAGAVLGRLDQPRPHRNDDTGSVDIEIAPLLTADGAGMALGGRF